MRQISSIKAADIHTHILPAIDDGPKTAEESIALLKAEAAQGINDIVLTPHFNLENDTVDSFLEKREASFKMLKDAIKEEPELKDLRLYLGAEVRYNPHIIYHDFDKLCIEGTNYILVELSYSSPFNLEHTLEHLINSGITPILAHVERYAYIVEDIKYMRSLHELGVVFQCNATSCFGNFNSWRIKRLLRQGLVDVLASDTHNLKYREPNLALVFSKLKKQSNTLAENSLSIINNDIL